jgi:hypothetical protein
VNRELEGRNDSHHHSFFQKIVDNLLLGYLYQTQKCLSFRFIRALTIYINALFYAANLNFYIHQYTDDQATAGFVYQLLAIR